MTTPTLTREQIATMPAGPELDALVAHSVFHVTVEGLTGFLLPAYSTDIAAAWLVVEKMDQACCFKLYRENIPNVITDYTATFSLDGDEPYDHGCEAQASADTAPLAICRAALLATLGADGDG